MKTFLVVTAAVLISLSAMAQVSVELTTDQDSFLPGESLSVAVKITNLSGRKLIFGTDDKWLYFNMETIDGSVVIRTSEVLVRGEFDVESSQIAIKHLNLQPYFALPKPGRYKVTATIQIKEWSASITSKTKTFDIVTGTKVWSQDFGLPGAANTAPEARRYSLEKANYLHSQLRLYVRVSDPSETHVVKVSPLGLMVSFNTPETRVDRESRLHVLWQSGSQYYNYSVVSPSGEVVRSELYDCIKSRPRLSVNEQGQVGVIGGNQRIQPSDIPLVKLPAEQPSPAQPKPK